MIFSFEDGFESINEALQEVNAMIFWILWDPLGLVQPDWSTQWRHALECYNMTTEGEDGDPRNINIPEVEGHRVVEGL